MLALDDHFDQVLCFQSIEVRARGGRSHVSHNRKLSACSRMAIHQAEEYANSRGFPDGRRNSGDHSVSVVFYIHTLIIDEVFMSRN
jgi:hypothetical protein